METVTVNKRESSPFVQQVAVRSQPSSSFLSQPSCPFSSVGGDAGGVAVAVEDTAVPELVVILETDEAAAVLTEWSP